ncbi:hypothetical protein [Sagittula sp. NFXS13]
MTDVADLQGSLRTFTRLATAASPNCPFAATCSIIFLPEVS